LLVFLTAAFGQPLLTQNAQPLLLDLARQNPDNIVSVIVQKNLKGDTAVEREITKLGGIITKDLHIINAFAAELPAKQAALLSTNPGVRWVSYDAPVEKSSLLGGLLCGDCTSPLLLQNVYDYSVNANKVWNNSSDTAAWLQGQGVGIAVVDSGVTANADLNGKSLLSKSRLVAQVKVNNKAATASDRFGHGTLVSGIIAGNGNLSLGSYIGIAPQANIIGVKVSDDNGAANESDVVSGLQWVNDNKDKYNIRVVNLSMNSTQAQSYQVDPLDAACEILWFNKVTVVVSAGNNGNDGSPAVFAPANDPFVITVGAANTANTRSPNDDTLAPFSAYGKDETGSVKPDIVAPGFNLVSTKPGLYVKLALDHPEFVLDLNYMRVAGTSFAAPQVAAAAALLLQSEPNLTPDQVKYRLKATALTGKSQGKWDTRKVWSAYDPDTMGAGYLDIYAAVTQKNITGSANQGIPVSKLLWSGNSPVNWSSVNWSSVNWSSVNWSSVNWSSVNWSGDYWGK
jgi:serine protease AprX